MPRTLDRSGATLNGGEIERQIGLGSLDVRWSVRLVDMAGAPITVASWIYAELPQGAIVGRNRQARLDGGPASLTLSVLASALPLGVVPKPYWRIEIDRIIGSMAPNAWPYFTGIIDKITTGFALDNGAIVKTFELACLDTLQRAKGYHVNSITVSPVRGTDNVYKATGVCSEVRRSFVSTGASTTQNIPGAYVTYDLAGKAVFDDDAAFGSALAYTTAYTIDATVYPATITWTAHASVPAAGVTVYCKFPRVEHFGLRTYRTTVPGFFRLPYARDKWDLYHTEVSSYAAGGPTITPKDPNPYDSDNALLDPSGTGTQLEYLAVTQATTGEQIVREIISTSNAGVITLGATITFADGLTPVAGDLIRVVTTDLYPAWEEYGQRYSGSDRNQIRFWYHPSAQPTLDGAHNSTTATINVAAGTGTNFAAGDIILIDGEQMYVTSVVTDALTVSSVGGVRTAMNDTTAASHSSGVAVYIDWKRRVFEARPNAGIAIARNYHFLVNDTVFVTASPVEGAESGAAADANRVEEVIKDILGEAAGGTGLYLDANIITGLTSGYTYRKTGAYTKNFNRYQVDLSEVLREYKDGALPPSAYIRGERDGKISILSYSQAATEDLVLRGVSAISESPCEEPITATVVIAQDADLTNFAPLWFDAKTTAPDDASSAITTPEAAVDGVIGSPVAAQAAPGTPAVFRFTVPGANPLQAFPEIEKVQVYGTGFISVYVSQSGADYYVPGQSFVRLKGDSTAHDIGREELAQTAALTSESSDWTLVIELHADDTAAKPGPAGQVSEIQIWGRRLSAWRAELGDDTTGMPTVWKPSSETPARADTEFGSVWAMGTPGASGGAGTTSSRVSRLWAPADYLKRVCPKYNAAVASIKHRFVIVRLEGISQADTRRIAEDYQWEFTRQSRRYTVRCLLDDRIEIGDTVLVICPPGETFEDGTTIKRLFVWGYADGGDAGAHEMDLELVDYS
jgi:hypothetical protein